MGSDLWVQSRPGSHAHRPVAGVFACVFGGGLRPGARVSTFHLRPVTPRPSGGGGWTSESRIGVEAATRPQTEEDLARPSLKPLLHLDGIVTGVEDEQEGRGLFLSESTQQSLHLLGSDQVGVLHGMDTLHIHGGTPTLADEVELGDELVGPSGYDGLASGVAGRMVVVAALRA